MEDCPPQATSHAAERRSPRAATSGVINPGMTGDVSENPFTSVPPQSSSVPASSDPNEQGDWLRVPAVVDANGDKLVTLYDEQGRPYTRPAAEITLETFVGPRPPGHVIRFKDGNRLNGKLSNLERVVAPAARAGAARPKAVATRERADAIAPDVRGPRAQ